MGCGRVTVIGCRRGVLPLVLTLVAFGVARPGGQQPAAPTPSATVTLSIVGTNDLHGAMAPRDGRGGLATFSGFVNNLRAARARDGGAVLVIDAGDMFQGTLESNLNEGTAIVDAYNAIGYTAVTIGNHEFDFGPLGPRATPKMDTDDPRGALKARAVQARFPFLAANLVEIKTAEPVRWPNVQPAVLVHAAGVNVGIIGVTTSRTLKATISGNTIGLAIAPLDTTIADQAARLRARGATVIIVTAHAGGRCTRFDNPADLTSCEQPSEIGEVVTKLPRGTIDAVVAGHTHQGMAHEVLGVPIIESFSSGRAFGRIDLTIARDRPHVASHRIFPPRDVCAYEDASARCADLARTPGAVHVQYRREGRRARSCRRACAGRRNRQRPARQAAAARRLGHRANRTRVRRGIGLGQSVCRHDAGRHERRRRRADQWRRAAGQPAEGAADLWRSVRGHAVRQLHGAAPANRQGARARAGRQRWAPVAAFSPWPA